LGLYLFEEPFLLVSLERRLNYPPLELLAVVGKSMISQDSHERDIEQDPVIHSGSLLLIDFGLLDVVVNEDLFIDID